MKRLLFNALARYLVRRADRIDIPRGWIPLPGSLDDARRVLAGNLRGIAVRLVEAGRVG